MEKLMNFQGGLVIVFWVLMAFNGIDTKGGATGMNIPSAKAATEQQESKKESPFACNLSALDADGRRRHGEVTKQMRAAIKEVQALPDGYAFRFPAEQSNILLASEFMARERLCCPFFTFELVAEQEDGPLWLRLRGREGVKDFIRAEFGIK
ncbi:MAG TPA: hypothetical protein VJ302_00885 [Blastocatellia bacterium]|nr:hypothetical protein [Blastocatellia bacterium]